jgi:predicted membrane-bound mannosyltransferase
VVKHPTTQRVFLIWAFLCSLAVYSWASERFAWLVLHPLLPLTLLAGIGVQVLLEQRARRLRLAAGIVVAGCLAYSAYATWLVNARHGADPREWLVSTQSSQDVKDVADRVRALGDVKINVDSGQGATFPYAWYFRDLDVGYIDMSTPGYQPSETQVLIMTEQGREKLLPLLTAYEGRKFRFRVWWVRDWDKMLDPGAWWHWFTERKTWNPTGGLPEWVYVRRDVAD